MTRPTKEQLKKWRELLAVRRCEAASLYYTYVEACALNMNDVAHELFAEIRALRGDLSTALSERDGAVSIGTQLERERNEAQATLARLREVIVRAQGNLSAETYDEHGDVLPDAIRSLVATHDMLLEAIEAVPKEPT